jgi:hypothetical protein
VAVGEFFIRMFPEEKHKNRYCYKDEAEPERFGITVPHYCIIQKKGRSHKI